MFLTVPEDMLLLEALVHFFPDSSRRTLQNWLKWERISIDGECVKITTQVVKKGQSLSLSAKDNSPVVNGIPILYNDRWMTLINKPTGLLSVPADHKENHALGILRRHYKTSSIFAAHRIDQDTSGLLLFARGVESREKFKEMFGARLLEREYLAIVEGNLPQDQGTWEHYLREKENFDVEITTPELGELSVTHFEVVRRSKKFTYLRLKLETGKKHQIRVHLQKAGFPILGDKRYGSTMNPAKRACLHSYSLRFQHPFTDKEMSFIAPLPKEFETLGFFLNE